MLKSMTIVAGVILGLFAFALTGHSPEIAIMATLLIVVTLGFFLIFIPDEKNSKNVD